MKNFEETKCNHKFWKDENPPNCLNCGKTKYEIIIAETRKETIKECVEKERNYKNTAGEACVVLAKILSQKQLSDIIEDELRIATLNLEAKRQQDEINYIKSLQNQIAELQERLKNPT